MSIKDLAGMFADHPDDKPVYNPMAEFQKGLRHGIGLNMYRINEFANMLVDSDLEHDNLEKLLQTRILREPNVKKVILLTRAEFEHTMLKADEMLKFERNGQDPFEHVDLDYWNDQPDYIGETDMIWTDRITRLANTVTMVTNQPLIEAWMADARAQQREEIANRSTGYV